MMNICCPEVKVSTKVRDKSTGPTEQSNDPQVAAAQTVEVSEDVNELQQQVSQLSADSHAMNQNFAAMLDAEISKLKHYIDCAIKRDNLIKRP